MTENFSGPMSGIRIVDLTSAIAGPAAMVTLGDQGADVIKVETPSGDIMRARGTTPGMAASFVACNRGKRSIILDLKNPSAAEVLWRLIESADVFAQNFRPHAIDRLGFSAEDALKRNPRLIYLSINGVGERGPYVEKRVYDPIVQALSGITDIQSDPLTGRPTMLKTPVADSTTAIYAAQAVSAALFARERTGLGQHVRLSMLDTMISYIWPEGMTPFTAVTSEPPAQNVGARDMIFQTRDGYITIAVLSDAEWHGLCAVLEKPEWESDPRYATVAARVENRDQRLQAIETATRDRGTSEILKALDAADVPCAPVLTRQQMLDDPQVRANAIIGEIDQPAMGPIRQARHAARFDATPIGAMRPAPLLGEHTEMVMAELGYGDEAISDLRAQNVFGRKSTGKSA
ncbi:MAG: CoA transferase [Proteobacteria bacterium]|nr:CoA transferase [Pseudomonadota bacterium]